MFIARHHAEWLSLLEISGPFLSMPVLLRIFPQGLDEDDSDLRRELRLAYEEWLDNQFGLQPDPAIHYAWVRYVLGQTLGLPDEVLAEGQAIPPTLKATIAEQGETLRPDIVVRSSEFGVQSLEPGTENQEPGTGNYEPGTTNSEPGTMNSELLIQIVPASQALDKPLADRHWKASPAMRMMELLHATGVRLGLVTNGEQWLLVNAPRGETTGFIAWYAELWLEENITLRAFRSLLGVHRFFAAPEDETLAAMLAQSQDEQHEVTDQLGYQVRRAVEVLVQAIDLADRDTAPQSSSPLTGPEGPAKGRENLPPLGGRGGLLAGVSEAELYEAALTIMMRLVFLFSAEERGLFPLDDDLYNQYYAASTLRAQLREAADQFGEEVIERRLDAWPRLLTIFRAVHSGIKHDRLHLPAYGGSLFDPDRFPFLEGRPKNSRWHTTPADPLPINNRTVLHLLEALQLLQVRLPGGGPAEARRLSFRALDIEQIGHVYESLLDHTAVRAETVVLGLEGKRHHEPEVPLEALEAFTVRSSEFTVQSSEFRVQSLQQKTTNAEPGTTNPELINYLQGQTGRTANALRKALQTSELETLNPKLRIACGNDDALYQRVLPFAGLLREDDLGQPVVILPGSVYVTAGAERRATGTHYTPRSLTEPIVQHTLEPLIYDGPAEGKPQEKWQLRSPAHLLNLKICDMAMGSGAFLVQTCRYLSERLVEAWENVVQSSEFGVHGSKQRTLNLITPAGKPTSKPDEAIPANTEDRLILARRLVADRCLYGVDKNPLAVEMAKLSLWLITLDKNRPFTFLDHALKCGDSLVGVNLDQLITWNLAGQGERRFETLSIQAQIERMVGLRRQIASLPVNSIADQEHKRLLFEEAEAVAHDLRQGGDMLVGSYFNDLSKDEQEYLRTALLLAFRDGQDVPPDRAKQADLGDLRPFHWPLEFPEVFLAEGCSGFGAFMGNPPFIGGRRIRETLGDNYRELLYELYPGSSGNADYSAFFFLRGFRHLQNGGALGLIATNTISQGDTRLTGLDKIVEEEGTIYRGINSQSWPGQAAVIVSVVHVAKGRVNPQRVLDGLKVQHISSLLDSSKVTGDPYRLEANRDQSFQGSLLRGMGFLLTPEEARGLIDKNLRNSEVIQPYLNGQDFNTNPDQSASRWTINFFNRSLDEAETYYEPIKILRERVYPERMGNEKSRKTYEKMWWQFWRPRVELYRTIRPLRRVLALTIVSKTVAFAFIPPNWVYAHRLVIFAFEDAKYFALLQSSFHYHWAWKYSSTLKQDLNYSPTDVFQTFPFPNPDPEIPIPSLETIGETYHEFRCQLMLDRWEGLTATYNRFHNPEETAADIARLRELHVEMDQAVATAYGWADLDLGHDFHETPQGLRFTISEPARREVLGRLLALNHERYAEEVKAGLHDKRKGKKGSRKVAKAQSRQKKRQGGKGAGGRQASLPGLEDDSPE